MRSLKLAGVPKAFINLHHHAEQVEKFLQRPICKNWLLSFHEQNLLGTAGTLRAIYPNLKHIGPIILIHADNWSNCSLAEFINFHTNNRPAGTVISMMTFDTDMPTQSGITEIDNQGKLAGFYEKVADPPGNRANAAVYIIEREVIDWLNLNPEVSDFSTEVIPHYLGQIACWHHSGIHRDIGSIRPLISAQSDPQHPVLLDEQDIWLKKFQLHPIHELIRTEAASLKKVTRT